MNTKHLLTIGLFILIAALTYGQSNYPTRDSVHIFWQADTKITKDDYLGPSTNLLDTMMAAFDFSASASVGIWSVLDVPERKKDRNKKFEKVYFAPAFERTTSYKMTDDSLQIEMQNIYFDICELWARWARRELQSLQDSIKGIGTVSIFYTTVKEDMERNKIVMYRAYFKEVFVNKTEGAFDNWRHKIDEMLAETTLWATTPEECYRLLAQVPIEEGYIMAPTLIGPMFNRKE